MERRNWSLKALEELNYINSLDDDLKAQQLEKWIQIYLTESSIESFDLEIEQLYQLQELFYQNRIFLKNYTEQIQSQLNNQSKIKEFLN